MKYLFLSLLTFILVLLQTSLIHFMAIRGVWPNLVLVTLLALGITKAPKGSFFVAVLGGVLLDLSRQTLFGLSSLMFVIFLTFVSFYIRIFGDGLFQRFLLGFLFALIYRGIFAFSSLLFAPTIIISNILSGGVLDGILLNVVYPFILWIQDNLLPRKDLQLSFRRKL